MDTSDTTLTFDERGWCDYCRNFQSNIKPNWHPGEQGIKEIMPLIEKIKREGTGRDHDCLIGISGGIDSSYVTYVAKEKFGLRPSDVPLRRRMELGSRSQQYPEDH